MGCKVTPHGESEIQIAREMLIRLTLQGDTINQQKTEKAKELMEPDELGPPLLTMDRHEIR